MKKFIFGLIAVVMLSFNSFAQNSNKALGCSADCFFNECIVRCPSGSIPKCKCIVGSFSSCSCSEVIGKVSIKNEKYIEDILSFLELNNLNNYKILFSQIFNALKSNDDKSFKINFDKLETLSDSDAANAQKIEDYVTFLKSK